VRDKEIDDRYARSMSHQETTTLAKPRKVLVMSASAGTGHLRAAEAIESVCRENAGVSEVQNIDALNYTNKLFRDFYSKLYIKLVEDAPTFLGWWYETSDEPWKTDRMRLMLSRLNTQPLVDLIRKMQPDVAVCTHFLPAEIISWLLSEGKIRTRLAIVVTDLDFHAMWLSRVFHRYFVALDETKAHLEMLGLPAESITVSGIPILPVFAVTKSKKKLREQYGLDQELPVILVSAGALSVGPADLLVRHLRYLRTRAQIVVVCGKDENLRKRVTEQVMRQPSPHLSWKILGYTNKMDEWMTVADLFLGKPGGLTVAEALAKNLPFAVVNPIPGQEERNSDHLLEKGVGIKINDLTTLAYKIDQLFSQPGRFRAMRAAAREIAKPNAARHIVETLLEEPMGPAVTVQNWELKEMAERARRK
jgi:processive 1,2-diacylglycerol beta-glucosyltransferase